MSSISEPRFLSSQQSEVEAFQSLLREYDADLNDCLILSGVHPVDYADSFDRTRPSLRSFMFNMQINILKERHLTCPKQSFSMRNLTQRLV